jgi:hypothetical protein
LAVCLPFGDTVAAGPAAAAVYSQSQKSKTKQLIANKAAVAAKNRQRFTGPVLKRLTPLPEELNSLIIELLTCGFLWLFRPLRTQIFYISKPGYKSGCKQALASAKA